MKKFLLLISVIFVAIQFIGYSQTGFDLLWKIDNWGTAHKLDVSTLARFSPDGKSIYFVADSSYNKLSRVYQISSETGEAISQSEGGTKIVDFDLSGAGNVYATAQQNAGINLWDTKTHKLIQNFRDYYKSTINYYSVIISPDEKYLIAAQQSINEDNKTYSNVIRVYDIATKKIIKEIPSMEISELRYSRDGKTFVAGGVAKVMNDNGNYENKERLILYDATTWKEKAVLAETYYENGFYNIHYSFDGKYIGATGTYFACISNLETMQTRKFNNDATYGTLKELQLLEDAKDYYIIYSKSDIRVVIYNDGKVVNSYKNDNSYLATGIDKNNFKILTRYGGIIGVLVSSPTSVKETEESSIYVKYSDNYLSVTSSEIESQTAKIIISDISGKEVYSGALELPESGATQISLKLENGIYLYRIVLNSQEFTGKFEVVR